MRDTKTAFTEEEREEFQKQGYRVVNTYDTYMGIGIYIMERERDNNNEIDRLKQRVKELESKLENTNGGMKIADYKPTDNKPLSREEIRQLLRIILDI